jgi:hypothetical protein
MGCHSNDLHTCFDGLYTFECHDVLLNRFPCAAERGTVGTAGQGFDGQRVVRRRVRCAHNGRTGDESCSAVGVKLSNRIE